MDLIHLRSSLYEQARLSFSRSGGPGGQNVNKVNTKVELRIPLSLLRGLSAAELENLRQKLIHRISSQDELIVVSSEERSQQANRLRAFDRAEALIVSAARFPKHRKPTAPSKASQERRLAKKRVRGLIKNNRQIRPFIE